MEKEFTCTLMVINMMGNGLMIKKMEEVAINILITVKNMMVNGMMEKNMVMEYIIINSEINILVIG